MKKENPWITPGTYQAIHVLIMGSTQPEDIEVLRSEIKNICAAKIIQVGRFFGIEKDEAEELIQKGIELLEEE